MGTKLLEITPQYRSFVDDQVLTSGQLNEFIGYFEDQDRLSRICLVGIGLVCGFEISVNKARTAVTISQGCGLTTDGDLIKLQQKIKDSSDVTIGFKSISYSYFRNFEDGNAHYNHFKKDSNTAINLWELVEKKEDGEENLFAIKKGWLDNKVVVLYLESYPKQPDICTTTNCDSQGQPNIQKLRVLLIDRQDVVNVVNPQDRIFTKHDVRDSFANLPKIAVPKVIINQDHSGSFAKISALYNAATTSLKNKLHDGFGQLLQSFSEILDVAPDTSNAILNGIKTVCKPPNNGKVQYCYGLLRDLTDSYNELGEILLKLRTECCPDINAFPKHLLLGIIPKGEEVTKGEGLFSELRHDFYPSPTHTEFANYLKRAKSLISRVGAMLANFNLDTQKAITITPSKTHGALGQKAIPVYYNVDEALLKAWDFAKTENRQQSFHLSYHKENLSAIDWVQHPLMFALSHTDFFRIEGHFGQPARDSLNEINSLKASHGLDFDSLLFDLQTDLQSFTAFVREHPAICHMGGVPEGGTYILISEKGSVVADFCLPSKVTAANMDCCPIVECTYPWISSLKYMNNLARSLKGTQSRNKSMPKNYVLHIFEYKINGEPLINNPITLSIPLEEIFLRRMHAVTEALNRKFDKGVVFDFNESQKRLAIIRAREDTFTIRLKENSIGNNFTYTYSNNGMFRENQVFRPDAMRCRELHNYREAFYQKLHAQLAPVNKDDDYGTYNDKWAKWNQLTERLKGNKFMKEKGFTRMITSKAELPLDDEAIMDQIIYDLRRAGGNTSLTLYLDGDWVNGTWVNNAMLDHYRANKTNTHDDIVLFVNLRKYLHNETGVTKFSIYITPAKYSKEFDSVIERYKTRADFYFGKPTGELAIPLT